MRDVNVFSTFTLNMTGIHADIYVYKNQYRNTNKCIYTHTHAHMPDTDTGTDTGTGSDTGTDTNIHHHHTHPDT